MFGDSIAYLAPFVVFALALLLAGSLSRKKEIIRVLLITVGLSSLGIAVIGLAVGSGQVGMLMIAAAIALGASTLKPES